jgi:hypothetical protein
MTSQKALPFFMSWKRCAEMGLVDPLWISYERDFLGDKQKLADRIADFIGDDWVDREALMQNLAERKAVGEARFNKSIRGRGQQLPDSIKDRIRRSMAPYEGEFDVSEIIGEF